MFSIDLYGSGVHIVCNTLNLSEMLNTDKLQITAKQCKEKNNNNNPC